MFRKKLVFKSKDIVGGKELKAFRERTVAPLLTRLGAIASGASELVGEGLAGVPLEAALMRSAAAAMHAALGEALFPGGKKAQLAAHGLLLPLGTQQTKVVAHTVSEIPLFFEFDRLPPAADAQLGLLASGAAVPTIFFFHALTQLTCAMHADVAPLLPAAVAALMRAAVLPSFDLVPLVVHAPATRFVLENGADLMAPGLAHCGGPCAEGALVALHAPGNAVPFAIGIAAMALKEGATPSGTSGKVVRAVHSFDDLLWHQFVRQYTGAMQQRAKAAGVRASERLVATTPPGFAPHVAQGDPELLAAVALLRSDAAPDEKGQPGESAAAVADPAPHSDMGSEPACDAGAEAVECFVAANKTRVLEYALCEAVRRIPKAALPLPVNEFIAQWFVPCRPRGLPATAVGFRDSEFKKAITFLRAMQERHEIVVISEVALGSALDAKAIGSASGTSGVFMLDSVNKACRRMGEHKAAVREADNAGAARGIAEGGSALVGIADEPAIERHQHSESAGGRAAHHDVGATHIDPIEDVEVLYRAPRNWHSALMYALFRVGAPPVDPAVAAMAAPTLADAYGPEAGPRGAEVEADDSDDDKNDDENDDDDSEDARHLAGEAVKTGLPLPVIRANYRQFLVDRGLLVIDPTTRGRPVVRVDATFAALWKRSATVPETLDLEQLLERCLAALLPAHRISFAGAAAPPRLERRLPPMVELIAEKRGGNKTVTRALGLPHYFGDPATEALAALLRRQLSVSVAVDDSARALGPTKAGRTPQVELLAQGNCTSKLRDVLIELGLPSRLITLTAGKGCKGRM